MKWLENFRLVMHSSITTLKEKIEDPERMLHQLLVDMEEELEGVRQSVAEAIADEIQLGRQLARAREESSEWTERAAGALKRRDEGASRSALEQKLLADHRAESLQLEHERQKAQTSRLMSSVNDLEAKIRQARQKKTVLLARYATADSSKRIRDALEKAQSRSAFAQFRRLEERVDRAEALNEAQARMEGRDPDADELERQFQEKEREVRLEAEFEELKRRVEQDS